mgnify:CR=1 FL=1
MKKIVFITDAEKQTLFSQKGLKFLNQSWANYQYHITNKHKIYIHLLPKDIDDDTANYMINAIEDIHPCSTELLIYRIK